ncbi:MAG: DNA-J related domain-containing protein [Thiogranum sp.]|nr:DNA-J related domain-containing protein [Thiogranum sp.]
MDSSDFHSSPALDEEFFEVLSGILVQHPEGIGEHALLRLLCDEYFPFLGDSPWQPHVLFCAHFLLFHGLYQLRDRVWLAGQADIEISAIKIRWLPYCGQSAALGRPDALRDYYLDLSNLENTSERDVDDLLDSFWSRFLSQDERAEALQTLGLKDPVDAATIKKTYRRLAMQHHPDRGGDTERLQAINGAVAVLLKMP